MKQGARRWVVGLLAGGALAAAGCRGGEGNEKGREGRALETPQHRQNQPMQQDAARPLGASNEHPATNDQESVSGELARGTPLGGGTAAPNFKRRREPAGGLPRMVVAGLGTNLADAYRVSPPGGDTATGGSGKEGGTASQGGAAKPGKGAGSASGGKGGQQGRK
ncbi:hypothetical protein [Pyxidicoccus caerfyrddinensis]|uniref:hypothetical protein n=1 Tax=Pyxidicoccus caerfyrddinensis TaxID=2709663 RepID=UPI0013D9E020|nr:hypothetical protein [Pyxidicoccus caerfyrddinensis]